MNDFDVAALYDHPDEGFDLGDDERRLVDSYSTMGAAAYGEIEPASARTLFAVLNLGPDHHLLDLGSGAGRFVLQCALETEIGSATGIEASHSRDELARRARNRAVLRGRKDLQGRVNFERGDLASRPWLRETTHIYLGSTCFPDPLMRRISYRAASLPHLHRIITTRPFPDSSALRWHEIGEFDLPMTWANRVRLRIYGRREP